MEFIGVPGVFGTPHEIGLTHGHAASKPIARSIAFYTWMFSTTAKLSWPEVRNLASDFEPVIRKKWPEYLEEMSGIAEGAGVALEDIIAINVRTKITFGLYDERGSDGCTALSWKTGGEGAIGSWLAQNWDWNPRQQENLIQLTIEQEGKPTIKMMTEAGLIGKIGINSEGVGVCLNAIKARGMDPTRLPCHLGLRMVLESRSRDEAVAKLEKFGIASACHMLVADGESGGIGLEWSSVEVRKVVQNSKGQVFHSNHWLEKHEGVGQDTNWLEDSGYRVKRIEELCGLIKDQEVGRDVLFEKVFKDVGNWPGAICRSAEGKSMSATLFNIIMDLKEKKAYVSVGRPVEPLGAFTLSFD
ncbi:uncharacterized protein MYCFIDRAFT_187638 [Pseudocercospora fijiensis CIRAD86]|uniref:Peptidase C45 hydrolase domain-containing protein n=1 Tax=Pseudocercospora fijiensis (strain CIRAD86) TaxID=383855 RepID=M3A0U2_PSEFD|nr:uncharacterized protein MYCFIDRAFT_187638 [Pseudocercospora fijiensis CIRAD86]EME84749.1 hypothetical protein MYCFIDRAFT_187638 [Pseudocercospora fijiensis CIRAD86]